MNSIRLKSAARTLLAASLVCAAAASHATSAPAVRNTAVQPAPLVATSPGLGTLDLPWWLLMWACVTPDLEEVRG